MATRKIAVLAVYDSKAKVYSSPFTAVTVAAGARVFEDLVNDPRQQIHRHPEDYTLFAIGEFDEDTGVITPLENGVMQNLGNAVNFVREVDPKQLSLLKQEA